MGDTIGSPATSVVLGKRRRQPSKLVLQLSGATSSSASESDNYDSETVSEYCPNSPVISSSKPRSLPATIIVNGKLVADKRVRYHCTYEGCDRSYRKPSRLAEHERAHTGERPFICSTCQKSYLRENHLQAHARTHLPESARTFVCSYDSCGKTFWTSQHLKRHEDLHEDEKPYKCTENECNLAFAKNYQLRNHIAESHCLPGTKPYFCSHANCTMSFLTSQKLRLHMASHQDRRYACTHPSCSHEDTLEYFPTWTALQAHTRTAHPATCPYPSCNGKTFTQQKGLRDHLKIHEQREIEDAMNAQVRNELGDDEDDGRELKKRRGGEVGRDWRCEEVDCEKKFKSKKALLTHINVAHLNRREFTCSIDGCTTSFGYKHVLQRHIRRAHNSTSLTVLTTENEVPLTSSSIEIQPSLSDIANQSSNTIDIITGRAYAERARKNIDASKALYCPFPFTSSLSDFSTSTSPHSSTTQAEAVSEDNAEESLPACKYAFTRAYDLRRHLRAVHGIEVTREEANEWVRSKLQ